jgi:cytochrome c-type biogenesis protein CcmH/NrfG
MNKKNLKVEKAFEKQSVVIITLVAFLLGFAVGVSFTALRSTKSPNIISNTTSQINYDQMAKELVSEVLNDPENIEAWIQLGHVYFDTNQFKLSINAYEKALELNPNNASVLTDLGIMYRRSSQPNKAVESFNKAININPIHKNARINKGIVLLNDIGDREGAIQAWEELLAINPETMFNKNQSLKQVVEHYREGHDKK